MDKILTHTVSIAMAQPNGAAGGLGLDAAFKERVGGRVRSTTLKGASGASGANTCHCIA